jgi:hypothetical protein
MPRSSFYTLGSTRRVLHGGFYTLGSTRWVLHGGFYTLGSTRRVLQAGFLPIGFYTRIGRLSSGQVMSSTGTRGLARFPSGFPELFNGTTVAAFPFACLFANTEEEAS